MAGRQQPKSIRRYEHYYRLAVGAPAHDQVVPYARQLLKNEAWFHAKNCARLRMYDGIDLVSNRAAIAALERGGVGLARLNALKAICDTFTSRLSKDRPMPSFGTEGAKWEMKRRARKFREFIVGQMTDTEFDDRSRQALHDGTRLSVGFTRIDENDGELFAERVPINDLLFDRRELKYGKPRQAIRVTRVARDYLAELYPKFRDQIDKAPSSDRRKDDDLQEGPTLGDLDDYVDTFEAWHPPSFREATDGRHLLCIDGATLVADEWYEPRFPWSVFHLDEPEGFYGRSFIDHLAELQHRVNRIVRDIQLNLAATGRGMFLVNEANDIPTEMLTGMQPFKLKYKGGQPPVWNAPQPFNAAQLQALDKFIGWMFDLSGVSRANAESKSSLGAGASGVALDTQYDIDSDRFRMPQANYARYRLDGAQCYLDASARIARRREMSKGEKKSWVASSWKSRDEIQQLDYDKVALKEGTYKLRIEAVNFIPDTRAGKLAIVEQLAKAGVIPQWLVPTLFDDPDLAKANTIMLSAFRNAMRKMEELLPDESLPMPMPEAYNDLALELKLAVAYYNHVQEEGAPPEVQDRYRQYIDMVLLEKKNADPNVQATFGGAPPGPESMAQAPAPPLPGGVPMMPSGPIPPPPMIGAVPPQMPMAA